MSLTYTKLKTRQREERATYSTNLGLRVHRALSWLNRSEQCIDDLDAQFIFLWIAFNAAYAHDISAIRKFSERRAFANFLNGICLMDKDKKLYNLVWSEYSNSIRVLLNNQYVFQEFWDFHSSKITEDTYLKRFNSSKASASRALGKKKTEKVLAIIFTRLYILRNQIVHGGATWNSYVNRDQLRDSVTILGKLVPLIIEIMMDNSTLSWSQPAYPVVK